MKQSIGSRANRFQALTTVSLTLGVVSLFIACAVASPAAISITSTVPGSPSSEDQLGSTRSRRQAFGLMDDLPPPPFPLDEFAGHDLVAPISLNGAHLGEQHARRTPGPADSPGGRRADDDDDDHHHHRAPDEADAGFSGSLETNVTASLGQTAFLRCRLKNSQHQVTWIRLRDWHILTSGLLTYTADARFRVKHAAEASEWTLEIKYLQKRDEGTYYCQIPTRTGTAVHAFHLHVASPQAVILGGHVSHVDIHTPSLTLVCIVDNTPDPPQVIFWYHNGTLLKDGKYPETGGGSGAGVEAGVISSHLTLTATRTMSMLTLQHIQHMHSGNYTCQAPNAEPDSTQLFVTQRHEAAVHRSSPAPRHRASASAVWLLACASLIGHVGVVRRIGRRWRRQRRRRRRRRGSSAGAIRSTAR